MSRLYDTVEPSVVDEDMLQKAVEEQGPKEEAGKIAKEEGIDFGDVKKLRLDFKNVLKIDNLWCFTNLVKLQLDNNIIEKVEGLNMLTNLIWLDLSFNNIEMIDGLDKLTKLKDLTLFNNRIQTIENMDYLSNLHVFSIGNNNLKQLDNLTYLRRFPHLLTLNLSGNPICELEEYQRFVIAYLPKLEYLDYRLVDDAFRQTAYEKYEISIQEIQHDELQAERKLIKENEHSHQFSLHKEAYVENLNGPQLFDGMYADDPEGQKLNLMPGVSDLLIPFKEKFSAICQEMFDHGLLKHEERKKDVNMFWECFNEAKNENKETGMKHIEEFMSYKKWLWQELIQITDQRILDGKITEYNNKVKELWDSLMGLEMQLVDQLEEAIKDFERNMSDMVGAFLEVIQGFMSQCRDLENTHHERLMEIAIMSVEKMSKNEFDDDIPEDLRDLFVDKDTIISAVQSSHDVHLMRIDNREDDLITRINHWMQSLIDEIHAREEVVRNRKRVTEINHLIDHLREELDNLDIGGPNY